MGKLKNYLWLIVVVIYLIMPWDLFPGLLDDMVVLGAYLLYLLRYLQKLKQGRNAFRGSREETRSQGPKASRPLERDEPPTLSEAYAILGLSGRATAEEVRKAYRARIAGNHPDKVNHLSPELREHAGQLTLRINQAYLIIKQVGKKG